MVAYKSLKKKVHWSNC